MKNKAIISCILLALLIFGCSPGIKNLNSQGKTVVCFGDSITMGEGAFRKHAYPKVLGNLINRKVINAGVGGDTTSSALRRVEKDVLGKDPYLVIIELGGNDFIRRMPAGETFSNLDKMIDAIIEKDIAVALCDISVGMAMSGYKKRFRQLAKRKGVILVPSLLEGVLDDENFRSDLIHPNREGYALIAKRVHEQISKYYDF